MQIKNNEEKPNKSSSTKLANLDTNQSNDNLDKIFVKDSQSPKDQIKEDSSNKKEAENDVLSTQTAREKNILTIELSNDEKIVFSQLGINPLIKLGKEYLTSNNFVRLKDNYEQETALRNKKTTGKQIKKISISNKEDNIEINTDLESNADDKSNQKTDENEEVLSSKNNQEINLSDEMSNARKKRRRSSASIE